mgnify:CR=1 FL=1
MSGKDKGKDGRKPLTQLVQAGRKPEWTGMLGHPGGMVSPPVWRASTILYDDVAHLRQAAASSISVRVRAGSGMALGVEQFLAAPLRRHGEGGLPGQLLDLGAADLDSVFGVEHVLPS